MSNDLLINIKAIIAVYYDCAQNATKGLIRNWIILPASIAAFIITIVAATPLQSLGIVGGFVLGLIQTALLSLYYSWLSETHSKQKIGLKDLFNMDWSLFMSVISVAFLIWIIQWITLTLINGLHVEWIAACVMFVLIVVFNSLPETIYIHRYESTQAMQESFSFIQKNWIEWYIPFFILLSPWIIASPSEISMIMANTYVLFPVSILIMVPSGWVPGLGMMATTLLGIVLANWFMLFRAHLFSALESGTRRQRAFKARF